MPSVIILSGPWRSSSTMEQLFSHNFKNKGSNPAPSSGERELKMILKFLASPIKHFTTIINSVA
jgi:hypothetical protein